MRNSRLAALIRKEFIQVIRDPRALAVTFILPIMMLLLLGYAATNDVRNVALGVWDQDNSPDSRTLIAAYQAADYFKLEYRVESPREVAEALKAKWELGLNGGVIIANPIPAEYAMDPAVISAAIARAVAEAEEAGVKGKDVTPFLLDRVQQITGGDSLDSNIQLVYNNARLGAEIATELAKL